MQTIKLSTHPILAKMLGNSEIRSVYIYSANNKPTQMTKPNQHSNLVKLSNNKLSDNQNVLNP